MPSDLAQRKHQLGQSVGARIASCALGGMGMALAVPPYGLWPLAWVALVPLWRWAIASQASVGIAAPRTDNGQPSWRQRCLYGLAWALPYAGITLHWLWDLHPLTWMGIAWGPSLAIAISAWLAVVAWRSLSLLLWILLTARLTRGCSSSLRLLVGVAVWSAVDLLWNWGPLYWDSFALSQSPHNLAILQLGRLGGPAAVNGAILAVNGLLAEAWGLAQQQAGGAGEPGQPGGRRQQLTVRQLWSGAIVLAIALHGLGALLYSQTKASIAADVQTGTPVKIGIIQGNVPTREKLSAAGRTLGVERYAAGFRELAARGAEAVLLPEGALPFVWSQRGQQGQRIAAAIADYPETELWLGTFERAEDGRSLTQSLLGLKGREQSIARYNKLKLVPLGEYVPGDQLVQSALEAVGVGRLSSLPVGMVPGGRSQRFDSSLGRMAVMICYEPAFSNVMRRQVAEGGRWLVTSSNLDPYGKQLMAQAEALDVMRAVESDRWGVRATNTGFSGVVDPAGRVQWRSEAGVWVTHLGEIYPRASQTLYVRMGDRWVWVLLGMAGVGLVLRR